MPSSKNRLLQLPLIDRVLSSAAGQQLIARYRRDYVTRRCREQIIGRIKDGAFLLDLRTIFDPDDLIPR